MVEKNWSDVLQPQNKKLRQQFIKTKSSSKPRAMDEIILLMHASRNRFKKSVNSGEIRFISKNEWYLQ